MAQDPTADAGLIIPAETREKHGPLIELIIGSESMNHEERQYWVNILPIMTPDQITNLETILTNEKEQLAAIDKKYSKEIEQIGQEQLVQETEAKRRERRSNREEQEAMAEQEESVVAAALLAEIEKA